MTNHRRGGQARDAKRPPVLGAGRHRNLFFNTGHDHMGWAMACGPARVVADLVIGRMPEISLEGLAARPAVAGS